MVCREEKVKIMTVLTVKDPQYNVELKYSEFKIRWDTGMKEYRFSYRVKGPETDTKREGPLKDAGMGTPAPVQAHIIKLITAILTKQKEYIPPVKTNWTTVAIGSAIGAGLGWFVGKKV